MHPQSHSKTRRQGLWDTCLEMALCPDNFRTCHPRSDLHMARATTWTPKPLHLPHCTFIFNWSSCRSVLFSKYLVTTRPISCRRDRAVLEKYFSLRPLTLWLRLTRILNLTGCLQLRLNCDLQNFFSSVSQAHSISASQRCVGILSDVHTQILPRVNWDNPNDMVCSVGRFCWLLLGLWLNRYYLQIHLPTLRRDIIRPIRKSYRYQNTQRLFECRHWNWVLRFVFCSS